MKKIHVVCPICNKFRRLPVPPEIFEIDEGALLKLPVRSGVVCNHQFIVLLDYHFSIRDYEVPPIEQFERKFPITKKKVHAWDFTFF